MHVQANVSEYHSSDNEKYIVQQSRLLSSVKSFVNGSPLLLEFLVFQVFKVIMLADVPHYDEEGQEKYHSDNQYRDQVVCELEESTSCS